LEPTRLGEQAGDILTAYIAASEVMFGIIIVLFGLTAVLISIHDRHCELVEELREWRMQAQAGSQP
jgi:hypothetical protein